jgi:hypothetical protein
MSNFLQKRDGNRVARAPKTRTPFRKIVLRVSDCLLKRISLTRLAEQRQGGGQDAEPDGMVLPATVFVNH